MATTNPEATTILLNDDMSGLVRIAGPIRYDAMPNLADFHDFWDEKGADVVRIHTLARTFVTFSPRYSQHLRALGLRRSWIELPHVPRGVGAFMSALANGHPPVTVDCYRLSGGPPL